MVTLGTNVYHVLLITEMVETLPKLAVILAIQFSVVMYTIICTCFGVRV